jgi:hypothetical protein
LEERIESTRSILQQLVAGDNAKLCEGEILELSVQLDILIAQYYEENLACV